MHIVHVQDRCTNVQCSRSMALNQYSLLPRYRFLFHIDEYIYEWNTQRRDTRFLRSDRHRITVQLKFIKIGKSKYIFNSTREYTARGRVLSVFLLPLSPSPIFSITSLSFFRCLVPPLFPPLLPFFSHLFSRPCMCAEYYSSTRRMFKMLDENRFSFMGKIEWSCHCDLVTNAPNTRSNEMKRAWNMYVFGGIKIAGYSIFCFIFFFVETVKPTSIH